MVVLHKDMCLFQSAKRLYIGSNGYLATEVIQVRKLFGPWHEADGIKEVSDLELCEYVEAVNLTGDFDMPAGQARLYTSLSSIFVLSSTVVYLSPFCSVLVLVFVLCPFLCSHVFSSLLQLAFVPQQVVFVDLHVAFRAKVGEKYKLRPGIVLEKDMELLLATKEKEGILDFRILNWLMSMYLFLGKRLMLLLYINEMIIDDICENLIHASVAHRKNGTSTSYEQGGLVRNKLKPDGFPEEKKMDLLKNLAECSYHVSPQECRQLKDLRRPQS
ncbi:hypothetical protein POM88_040929 [Heracleum sosnowskyi]|uniref:Uncharacterized protein n=1 Tax=Heracleum sosnowskyi TaxID=360622 RepID=A0AAD8HFP2_9APIA|nr:hypothetical protein POM88_040929 [Heracleum sosnowskyi]